MTGSNENPDGAGDARLRREQVAAELRAAQGAIGQIVAQTLGARWRPEDVGVDLTSGVVSAECARLAGTLAFCVQLDDPALFVDQLDWLARMLRARGYDTPAMIPAVLDAYARACAGVGPAGACAELIAPVLQAARAAYAALDPQLPGGAGSGAPSV